MSLTLRAAALHPTVASCSSRRSGPGSELLPSPGTQPGHHPQWPQDQELSLLLSPPSCGHHAGFHALAGSHPHRMGWPPCQLGQEPSSAPSPEQCGAAWVWQHLPFVQLFLLQGGRESHFAPFHLCPMSPQPKVSTSQCRFPTGDHEVSLCSPPSLTEGLPGVRLKLSLQEGPRLILHAGTDRQSPTCSVVVQQRRSSNT